MKQPPTSIWWGVIALLLIAAAAALLSACGGSSDATAEEGPAGSAVEGSTSQLTDTGQMPQTKGHALFMDHCAKCHGPEGLGNGPSVGSLRTQAGMNLTILQDKSDEELLTAISQGKGTEMPPWGLILSLEERQELVNHIRTLSNQ